MSFAIALPYDYFPDPDRGRPIFNGYVYVGEADKDPELFPVQIYVLQEDGSEVPVQQPVQTGAGGVIQYNGSPAIITVGGNYSLRVRDQNGTQKYYVPNALTAGIIEDGAYIPLAGTLSGAPVYGPITYDRDNTTGWTMSQGLLLGSDVVSWVANAANAAYYITTRNASGDGNLFSFTSDGQFYLPSFGAGNNEVWVLQGSDFLGAANTLGIYSLDQDTGLRTANPVTIYTSDTQAFSFGTDGKVIQTGVVAGGDNDQVLATKLYVDNSIAGSGNLPPAVAGNVLIGAPSGGGWAVAQHIKIDEVTVSGLASIAMKGAIALENTDTGGTHMYLATRDITGGQALVLYGTGATDSVNIAPEGFLGANSFLFANGFLSLPKEPTDDSHAATKKYVDDNGGSGSLPSGATNDTLRYDGANWVASSVVTIDGGGNLKGNAEVTVGTKLNIQSQTTPARKMVIEGGFFGSDYFSFLPQDNTTAMQFSSVGSAGQTHTLQLSTDGELWWDGNALADENGLILDNTVVLTTGDQTINGTKTFNDIQSFLGGLASFYSDATGQNKFLVGIGDAGVMVNSGVQSGQLVLTTGAQSISGVKTFGDSIQANGGVTTATIHNTGTFTSNTTGYFGSTLTANTYIRVRNPAASPTNDVPIMVNGTIGLIMQPTTSVTEVRSAFGALGYFSSDARLKENVVDLEYGLDEILALRPVRFDEIKSGKAGLGFIAQESREVMSETADEQPDGYYAFNQGPIVAALVNAVKALEQRLEDAGI